MKPVKLERYEITLVRDGRIQRFESDFESVRPMTWVRRFVIQKYVKNGWALVSCLLVKEGSQQAVL